MTNHQFQRAEHAYVMRAAMRETMGRRTYGPGMVQDYIRRHLDALLPSEREAMAREIDEADAEERYAGLGDVLIDRPGWIALRDALRGGQAVTNIIVGIGALGLAVLFAIPLVAQVVAVALTVRDRIRGRRKP